MKPAGTRRILIALIALLLTASEIASAANLSGQLFRQNPQGPHPIPATGYKVYIYSQAKHEWIGPVLTDGQGRYTFFNQADGSYLLRVDIGDRAVWQQGVQIPNAIDPIVLAP